jgi:hypothetical protein
VTVTVTVTVTVAEPSPINHRRRRLGNESPIPLEVAENVRPQDLKRVMMTGAGAARRVRRGGGILLWTKKEQVSFGGPSGLGHWMPWPKEATDREVRLWFRCLDGCLAR